MSYILSLFHRRCSIKGNKTAKEFKSANKRPPWCFAVRLIWLYADIIPPHPHPTPPRNRKNCRIVQKIFRFVRKMVADRSQWSKNVALPPRFFPENPENPENPEKPQKMPKFLHPQNRDFSPKTTFPMPPQDPLLTTFIGAVTKRAFLGHNRPTFRGR